ncbi:MAG TPA: protein kinase [Steroidobacteraceae bacterium]|nr:protein kinase [Steroidobacteraceae bacterium]
MSATIHDAVNGVQGTLRNLDVPADAEPDVPDFTEDLADEVTSELAPGAKSPRRSTVASQPAPDASGDETAATDGATTTGANLLRGRYLLETQIGNGGTATVHRAVDLRRDGRRVAIKLLRPELRERPQSVARLQREFRQTQAVAHPNVVRFHDLDCDGDAWFIVMELLSGETLGPHLRRVAPAGLPVTEALRIAVAVGDALAHAHARGVTHGDVKPDNIFLTGAGDVRLFDFGVAPESAGHGPGGGAGVPVAAAATRLYAGPDVLAGETPAPRDDVFSLGCVIHEMVAGRHPYGRQSADRVRDSSVVPERLGSLGQARASAVSSALSLARAARPTMAEFVRSLRAGDAPRSKPAPAKFDVAAVASSLARSSLPVAAPVRAAPATAAQGLKRSRVALWIGLAAGLALVLGILIGRLDPGLGSATVIASSPPQAAEPETRPATQLPAADAKMPVIAPQAEAPATVARREKAIPAGGSPGIVFFDGPKMIVSNRAVVAAIPLRHLNHARRAVNVSWRILDGSARAGRDYAGPASGVAPFIEGNSFRILYVPILPKAGPTPDRSFTVELTGASDGVDLGPTPRVEINILGST